MDHRHALRALAIGAAGVLLVAACSSGSSKSTTPKKKKATTTSSSTTSSSSSTSSSTSSTTTAPKTSACTSAALTSAGLARGAAAAGSPSLVTAADTRISTVDPTYGAVNVGPSGPSVPFQGGTAVFRCSGGSWAFVTEGTSFMGDCGGVPIAVGRDLRLFEC